MKKLICFILGHDLGWDGTYNRERKACELLDNEALASSPQEPVIKDSLITEPTPEMCFSEELKNEVARLFEQLNRAVEIADEIK